MSKLRFSTAQEVFQAFPAAREIILTAPTTEPPLSFLRKLIAAGDHKDAIGFCAFLMPRREAVWWALQCVQRMQPPGVPADPGLKAAEAWVRDPTDETRHHASLGTWIALAAGYSGGSMVATHAAPCPPDLTAKTARIAVLTALGRVAEPERDAALRNCVEACIRLIDDESGRTRA